MPTNLFQAIPTQQKCDNVLLQHKVIWLTVLKQYGNNFTQKIIKTRPTQLLKVLMLVDNDVSVSHFNF